MKNILILLLLILPILGYSQTIEEAIGDDFKFNPNNIPCITEEAKAKIALEVAANIAVLKKQGKLSNKKSSLAPPTFIWPVNKSATATFNDVWAISNYVDHDSSSGLEDYNGEARTYNGHQGTDIYTWPFAQHQQENNLAEVVAAAPGTIYYKNDGEFDKNCVNNTSLQWNAVYVRHSDNSYAWYGHLKKGSLTTKNVGDPVVAGEYLGVVGSSGNSSGPHLHFEVYDNANNLIDPFSGSSNNITSWWQDQPDYYDPQINAVLTHSVPPEFNTCPDIETMSLQDKFLPNTDVYAAGYFKDQIAGTIAYYRLFKPGGGTAVSWNKNFTNTYTSSYWYNKISNLSQLGTYRLEIRYEGKVVNHTFEIVSTLGIEDEKLEKISIAPNPFENQLKISGFTLDQADYNMSVYNQLGQKVVEKDKFSEQLDLQFLSKGMYFLNIGNKSTGGSKTFKIVKK